MNTIPPSSPALSQPGPGPAAARSSISNGGEQPQGPDTPRKPFDSADKRAASPAARAASSAEQGFTPDELKQLTELKARDREVRAHELAHQAVGGQYAGAISYTFQRGPDGAQYAVGGEVSIDVSPVPGDPQATVEKMRVVRAAALAPAEPSGQDRAVAAEAMQIMLKAQSELASGDEPSAQRSGEGDDAAPQPRVGRQATGTYQAVAGMVDEAPGQASEFRPVAA